MAASRAINLELNGSTLAFAAFLEDAHAQIMELRQKRVPDAYRVRMFVMVLDRLQRYVEAEKEDLIRRSGYASGGPAKRWPRGH